MYILKKIDHLGYACEDLQAAIATVQAIYPVEAISAIIFDTYQNANICYITTSNGPNIELVCGETVKNICKKGLSLYHTCYEVDDIHLTIQQIKKLGGVLVKPLYAAPLFNNRRVAFLETNLGLIELLESQPAVNQDYVLPEICLTGSFTIDNVRNTLTELSHQLDLNMSVKSTSYNQIMQTLYDSSSIFYSNKTGHNLILLRIEDWLQYIDLAPSSFAKQCALIQESTQELIAAIKHGRNADLHITLVFCPKTTTVATSLAELIVATESEICTALGNDVTVLTNLLAEFNDTIYDPQADKIGNIPYTDAANHALSLQILRTLHLKIRKPYKVIVVDCDNTLWDGVCGEDGATGIKFNQAHLQLQQKLHELAKQGVLICLASKNSAADVLQVFAQRSEMLLGLQDITYYKINWELKSQNIREIAQVLNLHLDDFVFIDDNPLEIAEVASELSQTLCLQFPRDEQQGLEFLANAWCFDVTASTSFDVERNNFYKTNIQRENLKQQTADFSDFITKLAITTTIAKITAADYPRVTQLIQRTNQFNCSNIRRNLSEVEKLLQQPNMHCYKINVADRFGDYGLVGIIFLQQDHNTACIETFLLSCRVLGKGIEHQFLSTVVRDVLNTPQIAIKFQDSGKNQPALRFLASLPSHKTSSDAGFTLYEYAIADLLQIKYQPAANAPALETSEAAPLNSIRLQDNAIIHKILAGAARHQISITAPTAAKYSLDNIQGFLLEICTKVLDTEVTLTDNFFKIGGDSLLGVRILSRLKQIYGIDLDLDIIFAYPKLADLAQLISTKHATPHAKQVSHICRSPQRELSFTQEWLWLLDQYDQGNSWYYNMPHPMRLRGKLNVTAIEAALQQIVARHEALRMKIVFGATGYAIELHSAIAPILQIIDASGSSTEDIKIKIDALYRQPFRLDNDLLFRAYLLKLADDDQILLWVTHHIASDGWSTTVINAEFSALYNAYVAQQPMQLPNLAIQFFDYAAWQRQQAAQLQCKQLPFWQEKLQDLPDQQLPIDMPRTARNHNGKFIPLTLPAEVSSKLIHLAQQNNNTIFGVLLTLYAITIARRCNIQDVIITCPVSGRRHPDAEELIGCFVNIVVFRFSFDFKTDFVCNLNNNRDTIFKALENQDVPFSKLLEALRLSQDQLNSSLFQTMFALQNTNTDLVQLHDVQASVQQIGYDAARLELILELEQAADEIIGGFYYNTAIFHATTIQQHCQEYTDLCGYVVNQNAPLADFWDNTKHLSILRSTINYSAPQQHDIISWFEATVATFPNNLALKTQTGSLTYAELNSIANQMAHYLQLQGLTAGAIVAIRLPANSYSIISILAILKLGAAYLPIDSTVPDDYFETIINDSGCSYVVCATRPHINIPYLIMSDLLDTMLHSLPASNLTNVQRELAYIIYTSGTTGKPKGVRIPHRNIVQLLASTQQEYQFSANDSTLLFHSIAFDFSVWEMWLALCFGGKLYIPTRTQVKSAQDTFELVVQENITILNQTPTAFKQFCIYHDAYNQTALHQLRLVIFGGEKLTPQDLLQFATTNPHVKFYNMYGITETTVHTTIKQITRNDMILTSNIGRPLPGRSIYILDEANHCVPSGESGEIFVAGLGLAEGYHNLPERSAAVFVPDLFEPGKLMYKTGDLARVNNDGELEYLGRKDKQIQLRGFRIELPGIEATLNKHPGVKYSAVNVLQDQLVAYIVPNFSAMASANMHILPNGLPIHHLNKNETEFLYEEIFEHNEYLTAGISLENAQCILDIGANIGMFAVQANQIAPTAKIFAFEPIAEIYQVLQQNAAAYGNNIIAINAGVAAVNHNKAINFYPKMTIMSSLSDDYDQDYELIHTHIKAKLGAKYAALQPQDLTELINSYLEKRAVACEFVTLDAIIATHNLHCIDLLKVDVEKHEFDVLRGISAHNWQIVQQCVIEVHDQNNSLQQITTILKAAGFIVKVRQYHTLKESDLYVIYAARDAEFEQRETTTKAPGYIDAIRAHVKAAMPEYMLPQQYQVVATFPTTITGKIDFSVFQQEQHVSAIVQATTPMTPHIATNSHKLAELIQTISATWTQLLGHDKIRPEDNFFDIGGNSLMTIQAYIALRDILPTSFRMLDFFSYPTPKKLAAKIIAEQPQVQQLHICNTPKNDPTPMPATIAENDIAVIGYTAKFPQANNANEYWHNILNGIDCITHFTAEELLKFKVNSDYLRDPNFVKACGKIDNIDLFDCDFFGITPREAALMDPQHRIFLELCWHALESACYTPEKTTQRIGIYGGMGHTNYLDSLYKYHSLQHCYGRDLIVEITNHKDYLVNRVAYKLNLTGASININTACSTSLVSCVKACQSLLVGENDIALAGAISLVLPEHYGYFYQTDNVLSPDGVCRPFDKHANGTVIGSGGGLVVLKRLKDAVRDGDNIRAVIKGYAVNNDGNEKIGFTAPAVPGQAACITAAQTMAKIQSRDIGYIEAHGTGTKLGDPIEIAALSQVFKDTQLQQCAIGSVKANIGHADSASGIAGLLKVILMLQQQQIPPALNFNAANDQIDFSNSAFYVNQSAKPWLNNKVAAVSSFGIGGTNAHVIVAAAPTGNKTTCTNAQYLLILSAKTPADLLILKAELRELIAANLAALPDIAYTLQVGRGDFQYRAAWIVTTANVLQDLADNPFDNLQQHVNSNLASTAKDWLRGNSINWHNLHTGCYHNRIEVPSHPLHHKRCWYTDISFATEYTDKSISGTLLTCAQNLLGVKSIAATADFFSIGGDSLAALTLIEEINSKLHCNLTLDEVFAARTFTKMADVIRRKQTGCPAQIQLLKQSASKHNMVIIHAVGGSLYCYNELINNLTNTNVYGISYEDLHVSATTSIEQLAGQYIKLIDSLHLPDGFSLLGWSFGGSMAFEIARQLQQQGRAIAHVYMLDTWSKFATTITNDENLLRDLFHKRIMYVNDSEWAKSWNNMIWERMKMVLKYQPLSAKIPTTLFKATRLFPEFANMQDAHNYWDPILGDQLQVVAIDADHTTIVSQEHSLTISNYCNNNLLQMEKHHALVTV